LERYISTDELADRIISQDPTLLLIDVRDEKSYEKYSLTNAINIPLEKILDEDSEPYLNQDAYDVILYSNDNFYADQAWILCTRLDYKNLYVLKGGVTEWYNTIINPEKPSEDMASNQFELYSFRKAASMYFGVSYPEDFKNNSASIENARNLNAAPKKIIVRKKKKKAAEGGC
jgi:rhodanese-related sulfurtransferase